jgi:prepilin-type processing-associated H-X9-DG protein
MNAWSVHAKILPFLEQGSLLTTFDWDAHPIVHDVRNASIAIFRCASDSGEPRSNYRCNTGTDAGIVLGPVEPYNGIFFRGPNLRFADITDGLSNTAMLSEAVLGDMDSNRVTIPGDWLNIGALPKTTEEVYTACTMLDPATMSGPEQQLWWGGSTWSSGNYLDGTLYNHIMPPNKRSCTRHDPSKGQLATSPHAHVMHQGGATTASSRHAGGVNMTLCDGSLRFVAESIDLAVWRNLGRRNDGIPVPADY